MKKTNEGNKGITLIALIIAIIVMLILISVTINMVINGGLFEYAGKASKGYKLSEIKEIANMGVINAYLENYFSEGKIDPLEAALSSLKEAGIETKVETTAGVKVSDIKFVINGGLVLDKLVLETGENATVKVTTEVSEGSKKIYVLVNGLYHEIKYNEETNGIDIAEEGIAETNPTINTNIEVKAETELIKINNSTNTIVESENTVEVTAQETAGTTKIIGICGAVKKEIDVEIEPKTEITASEAVVEVEEQESKEITISGTNIGALSIKTNPDSRYATATLVNNKLKINGISKGTTSMVVQEEKRNRTVEIRITVDERTVITTSEAVVGVEEQESKEITISGTNMGPLSIKTNPDSRYATATLVNNKLKINGISKGTTSMVVQEEKRNRTVEIRITVDERTVIRASETSVEVGYNSKEITISGTNMGPLSILTNPDSRYATAKLTNNKLIISGLEKGSTSIVIKEGKRNRTVTINILVTLKYSSYTYAKKDGNGILTEKATFKQGNKEAIIPEGFKVINGTEGRQSIDDGLVIKAKDGSEFVWIPVNNVNDMFMCQAKTSSTMCNIKLGTDGQPYCATHLASNGTLAKKMAGRLYATATGEYFNAGLTTQTYISYTGLREPAIVTGSEGGGYDAETSKNRYVKLEEIKTILGTTDTSYDNPTNFLASLQAEYNAIVKSVIENKGFYVGRYETGMNNGSAVSKGDASLMVMIDWYSMYAHQKKYAEKTLGCLGGMIQGAAYDQVMKFVNTASFNVTTKGNGNLSKNIYNLEGNVEERTTEAYDESGRMNRGGRSASQRAAYDPRGVGGGGGSRLSLYLK